MTRYQIVSHYKDKTSQKLGFITERHNSPIRAAHVFCLPYVRSLPSSSFNKSVFYPTAHASFLTLTLNSQGICSESLAVTSLQISCYTRALAGPLSPVSRRYSIGCRSCWTCQWKKIENGSKAKICTRVWWLGFSTHGVGPYICSFTFTWLVINVVGFFLLLSI